MAKAGTGIRDVSSHAGQPPPEGTHENPKEGGAASKNPVCGHEVIRQRPGWENDPCIICGTDSSAPAPTPAPAPATETEDAAD